MDELALGQIMLITWDSVGTALLLAATFAIVIGIGRTIGVLIAISDEYAKREGRSDLDQKEVRKALAPSLLLASFEVIVGYLILIGFLFVGFLFPGSMSGDSLTVIVVLIVASLLLMWLSYFVAKRAVGSKFWTEVRRKK